MKISHKQFTLLNKNNSSCIFQGELKSFNNQNPRVWISQHYECSYWSIHCNFNLLFVTWQYNSSVLLPQLKKLCVHLPGQWTYLVLDTTWSAGTKTCKLLCSSEMDSFSSLPYWLSSRMPTVAEEIVLIMCLWPGESEKVLQFTTGETSFFQNGCRYLLKVIWTLC